MIRVAESKTDPATEGELWPQLLDSPSAFQIAACHGVQGMGEGLGRAITLKDSEAWQMETRWGHPWLVEWGWGEGMF